MVFFWFFWTKLGNIQVKGYLASVQKVQQPFLRIHNILYEYPFSGSQCFCSAFKWKGIWNLFSLILHWEKSLPIEIHFQSDTQAEGFSHTRCAQKVSVHLSLPLPQATAQRPALYLVSSRHSVLKTKKPNALGLKHFLAVCLLYSPVIFSLPLDPF